ncbi:MAG: hypothetical protein FWF15_10100 [Oscillospiraceae bacterium]|nr:hypothetical protein [Oscillospiraceae bacterium]
MKKLLAILMVIAMLAAMGVVVNAASSTDSVEALYMNIKPTIDGIFSEEEWGPVTVQARTANATIGDNAQTIHKDVDSPFYHCNVVTENEITLSWDMWLRWDEDFFYLAVRVYDTDGHSMPDATGGNIWNGDVIQFRIDGQGGPNASGAVNPPWSDVTPNIAVAKGDDGVVYIYDWIFTIDNEVPGSKYACVVEPTVTTYEVAIPHAFFSGSGVANAVYGMSLVVLNAPAGESYNSWLSWGDGICGPQPDENRVGSNAVKLSATNAIVIPDPVEEVEEQPADVGTPAVTPPSGGAAQTSDAIFAVLALMLSSGAVILKKTKK